MKCSVLISMHKRNHNKSGNTSSPIAVEWLHIHSLLNCVVKQHHFKEGYFFSKSVCKLQIANCKMTLANLRFRSF